MYCDNIWRRIFCGGDGKWKRKVYLFCEEEKWKRVGRKIFGEGKSFVEEKKNGRGIGSKNI